MATSTSPRIRSRREVQEEQPESFKPSIVNDKANRSERARAYEEKTAGLLNVVMRSLAANESTVADAAAIINYGPSLASKAGDLAAHDARVRKAIDFLATGTDNPYAALIIAALPIVAQITRNHETTEAKPFEIRVPFTKRTFRPKLRIRLRNPIMRGMTHSPTSLVRRVFGDPQIKTALIEQGVDVALPEYQATSNGNSDRS